jgi:hypothetical protein
MNTQQWWARDTFATRVEEPFRSDGEFWRSLAASADAFITVIAAAAVCTVLVITGAGLWASVAFVVPAGFVIRAVTVARASSRHSQAAFDDRRAWRDAERTAVASGFIPVLSHRHHSSHG